jgi:hypothetical protein
MTQFINKADLLAEIDKLIDKGKYHEEYDCAHRDGNNDALYTLKWKINNLKVKEIEENNQSEYSHYETVYCCGQKPRFKVGDTVACYESYSDYEGEYVYGIVTKVEFDKEQEDWVYTFDRLSRENNIRFESELVSDEAYTK